MFAREPSQSQRTKPKRRPSKMGEGFGFLPRLLGWGFIIFAVLAVGAMVATNSSEKSLVCQSSLGLNHTLTSFGGCTAQ